MFHATVEKSIPPPEKNRCREWKMRRWMWRTPSPEPNSERISSVSEARNEQDNSNTRASRNWLETKQVQQRLHTQKDLT